MLSLTDSIRISSPLTETRISTQLFGSRTRRGITIVRSSRRQARVSRCKCSATEQPQPQPQPQRRKQRAGKYKKEKSEEERGIDPVGFLSKYEINHKAFAQFLRERYKSLKDLKDEILTRHFSLKEMSTGYELLGMHRNMQHRVDYLEWAPGSNPYKNWSS